MNEQSLFTLTNFLMVFQGPFLPSIPSFSTLSMVFLSGGNSPSNSSALLFSVKSHKYVGYIKVLNSRKQKSVFFLNCMFFVKMQQVLRDAVKAPRNISVVHHLMLAYAYSSSQVLSGGSI